MTDRHEQARAEADRRVRDLENRNIYGPANSVGYLVGHAEGVEWADAKPRRMKRSDVLAIYGEELLGRYVTDRTILAFVRELGIEVTDDE